MGELVALEPGKKVGSWTIDRRLGSGAFGAIYRCKHNEKKGFYALKVEGANEQIQLLKMELYVLNELNTSGGRHFCKIEDKGHMEKFIYVVMTLVGRSLQDLRLVAPMRKFSGGTAIGTAIQCLEALEDLHSIGYLHRDIKPANYTIGRADAKELRKIYVLDFGMCRKFIHEDGTIKKPRKAANFRGTIKYAPVSCHLMRELCRLDDCESWLYMVVELTKGSLPWRNLRNMDEIGKFKKSCRSDIPMKQLFGGCPREYIDIMRMIDGGRFFDEPKYGEMYQLLRKSLKNLGVPEFPYDWEDEEEKRAEQMKNADKNAAEEHERNEENQRKERKKKEEDEEGRKFD